MRRAVGHVGMAVGVLLVVGLAAGALTGTPVFLSYVETGSMEPTLEAGDGFVAIPAPLAGEVQEGDVVVFEAQQLQGGGLTTHRVVGETEQGYLTRGDANPFTDQDGDEPPVTEGQIRAKALQVGGDVVRIPEFGTLVVALHSAVDVTDRDTLGIASLAVGGALLLLGALASEEGRYGRSTSRSPERDTGVDVRLVVAALTLLVVVPLTASMVLPGGVYEYGIVSADRPTGAGHVIEAGETEPREHTLVNSGVLPVYVSLQPASEGVTVRGDGWRRLEAQSTTNATVEITAPPDTGYYLRTVVEYRYVAILPAPVVRGLHDVHPWVPIVAIDGVVAVPFYLLGTLLLGRGSIRLRNRSRVRG